MEGMTTYATVPQLKIRVQINKVLTADQTTMFEELLEAASRSIDNICGRQDDGFVADIAVTDKYLTAEGEDYLFIPLCTEITSVAVKTSSTATTYTAWTTPTAPMAGDGDWIPCRGTPDDPVYSETPYSMLRIDPNGDHAEFIDGDGRPVVKITAKWGPQTTCPPEIREACLMQAARWYKKYSASMADRLGPAEFAQLQYRRALDSNVMQLLIEGGWVRPLYGGR